MRHASHALAHLGNKKTEPGPYALIIVSAEYQPTAAPAQPEWWSESRQQPNAAEQSPRAWLRVMTRLVPALDCPDLLSLLDDLTQLARERIRDAANARQLFAHLAQSSRDTIAAHLEPTRPGGRRRRSDPRPMGNPDRPATASPFPYQEALDAGLLWDPRTVDGLGFRLNDPDPITTHTVYLGVAVTSLDTTDHVPWTQRKKAARDRLDPGIDQADGRTVPAIAWALLDDHTALLVDRPAQTSASTPLQYSVTASATVLRDPSDRVNRITHVADLIAASPRLRPGADTTAETSQELWTALKGLHRELRTALYPASPTPDTTRHARTRQAQP